MSRVVKNHYSSSSAQNTASALTRLAQFDEASERGLTAFLAAEQIDWRDGRKPGLSQTKLADALNRRLQLTDAPEYLQLRPSDFNRIRVNVWIQVPDLSTGPDRFAAKKGTQVLGSSMSPLEVFLTGTLLISQKLFNDDYLRTPAEEEQISATKDWSSISPGLRMLPSNPRRMEFQVRMERALGGISTAGFALNEIRAIFKEARND